MPDRQERIPTFQFRQLSASCIREIGIIRLDNIHDERHTPLKRGNSARQNRGGENAYTDSQ